MNNDATVSASSIQDAAEIELRTRRMALYELGYIPVVRCKYCKYGRNAVSAYADMHCVRLGRCVTADWFCADGEGISNAVD